MDTHGQNTDTDGIPAEKLRAFQREVAATEQANAEPLPGPLLDAFCADDEIAAAGIRPVVAYDFVILRKVNSPLYRQTLEAVKPVDERKPTEWDDDEAYEMIFQFTTPLHEVRAALRGGREAFREAALRATADQLDPLKVGRLVELVVANFLRTFSTGQKYTSNGTEQQAVFTKPPAGKTTGSVGGSTTSRG